MERESWQERELRRLLETAGYSVRRIRPAPPSRRADYRAAAEDEVLLVEVKSRDDDRDFLRELHATGRAGSEIKLAYSNAISAQIEDAVRQLSVSAAAEPTALRLMAMVAGRDDPIPALEQFKMTLYGIVDLLTESGLETSAIPCFYLTYSDFFRFPELDGAIAIHPGGRAHLHVNSHAPSAAALRETMLYRMFGGKLAITDPQELEAQGRAFVANIDLPRSPEAEELLLNHLRQKYEVPVLIPFRPTRVRAAIMGPMEALGPDELA
jgi:hypothetical protein